MLESPTGQAKGFGLDSTGNREPLMTLTLHTEHGGSSLGRRRRKFMFGRKLCFKKWKVFSSTCEKFKACPELRAAPKAEFLVAESLQRCSPESGAQRAHAPNASLRLQP